MALSSVAAASLVCSLSDTEKKKRPKHRKRRDDKDDDSRHLKEARSSHKVSRHCSSEDVPFVLDSTMGRDKSLSSDAASSVQSLQQRQAHQPGEVWAAGSSGSTPRRRQAAMSASEKRDLDMMFRHQERHDGKSPNAVDLSRAKARQRQGKRGKDLLVTADSTDIPEETLVQDSELVAAELLAEEEAEMAAENMLQSPSSRQKKAKKKPRKRNKAKTEASEASVGASEPSGDDDGETEDPTHDGGDFEAALVDDSLPCIEEFPVQPDVPEEIDAANEDVEEDNDQIEAKQALEVDSNKDHHREDMCPEVVPAVTEEMVEVPMESKDDVICADKACDSFVKSGPAVVGTPTTEAESSRQNSEAGDDSGIPDSAAIMASSSNASDCGLPHHEGMLPSSSAEAALSSQTTAPSMKGPGKGTKFRKHSRAWADLVDSDEDTDCNWSGSSAWTWTSSASGSTGTTEMSVQSASWSSPASGESIENPGKAILSMLQGGVVSNAGFGEMLPAGSRSALQKVSHDHSLSHGGVRDAGAAASTTSTALASHPEHSAAREATREAAVPQAEAFLEPVKATQSWEVVQNRSRARRAGKF